MYADGAQRQRQDDIPGEQRRRWRGIAGARPGSLGWACEGMEPKPEESLNWATLLRTASLASLWCICRRCQQTRLVPERKTRAQCSPQQGYVAGTTILKGIAFSALIFALSPRLAPAAWPAPPPPVRAYLCRHRVALLAPIACTCDQDLLSGRKTQGSVTGTLLFGPTAPSRAFLRRHTGYVEQFGGLAADVKQSLVT